MGTIKIEYKLKTLEPAHDEKVSVLSYRRDTDDEDDYMYKSNEIKISMMKDYALSLSNEGGEGFIYLYPEQVAHLLAFIEQHMYRE